jgi:Protein of unknown function (DUF1778)
VSEYPLGQSKRTPEENALLVEKVRAHFAEQRSRGVDSSADETLEELERDSNAGRTVKWDVRTTPEEKLRWSYAAQALGLSVSEFVRDVANSAADEVLAGEPVGAS